MGEICATHTYRGKHGQFHCGDEENAYRNNSTEGVIDRMTPYGFGIPYNDKSLFNDMSLFGIQTQQWKFLLINYKRGNISGAKSLDISPQHTDTHHVYQMKDGAYC